MLVSAAIVNQLYVIYIPTFLSLLPSASPLGHHKASGRAPCAVGIFPLRIYFTYGSVLLSQFVPPSSSHLCVQKSILCVCVSIPALQVGSSAPFF